MQGISRQPFHPSNSKRAEITSASHRVSEQIRNRHPAHRDGYDDPDFDDRDHGYDSTPPNFWSMALTSSAAHWRQMAGEKGLAGSSAASMISPLLRVPQNKHRKRGFSG